MADLSEGTEMIEFDTQTYWIHSCIETQDVVTPHTPMAPVRWAVS